MDRITLNLSDSLGEKLRALAVVQKRTVSDAGELIIAAHFDTPSNPRVPAAEARALAELRRLGVDPLPHLEAILSDAAGGPAGASLAAGT